MDHREWKTFILSIALCSTLFNFVAVKAALPDSTTQQVPADNLNITRSPENGEVEKSIEENADNDILRKQIDTVVDVMMSSLSQDSSDVPKTARDAWIKMGNVAKMITDTIFDKFFAQLIRVVYEAEVSQDCMDDLLSLAFALKEQKSWASKMFDATGKIPAGFAYGTVTDLGHYDECLAVTDNEGIRGQYCMVDIHPPLPPHIPGVASWSKIFNFTSTTLEGTIFEDFSGVAQAFYERSAKRGMCIPSKCQKQDLQQLLDTLFNPSSLMITIEVSHCEVKEKTELDGFQTFILCVFATNIALVIIGAMIHQGSRNQETSDDIQTKNFFAKFLAAMKRFLRPFSITKNFGDLFDTQVPEGSFSCLNGIRVITMFWIILGHTYFVMQIETFTNARFVASMVKELLFQGIMNTFILVETFFVLSSFLVTISVLKRFKKTEGYVNIPRIIFLRVFRLAAPMIFVVLAVFLLPTIGSGPLWHEIVEAEKEKCEQGWYTAAFFVNNFFPFGNKCLIQTWFLGAELQMFLIFLPLIVILCRWKTTGLVTISTLSLAGCLAAGVNVIVNGASPTPLLSAVSKSDVDKMIETSYLPIYLHFGPYGVGSLLGYYLHENKNVKISNIVRVCGSILALLCASVIVLGTYAWNNGFLMTVTESALYAACHKLAWALCVSWFILLCSTGNGGVVNKLLSWKIFIPLSRINYMLYLWHFYVLWTRKGLLRERMYLSHYTMVCEYAANLLFSLALALVAYLLFEAPFNGLSKEYFADIFSSADCNILKAKKKEPQEDQAASTNF